MKDTVKERRLKTLFRVFRVFVIIAVIITAIIIFLNHHGSASVTYVADVYEDDVKIPKKDEYIEGLKEKASDIKGMTQYDKYMAGLNVTDGSDSDGDGLTDKQEIEEYGTDPLKASTSGDFYMDGYKVKTGMELTKEYTYNGEFDSQMSFPEEFVFSPTTASDYFATVEDNTGSEMINIEGKTTIRKYYVGNYASAFSVDLSKISYEKELSKDTIDIYYMSLSTLSPEKAAFSANGSVITLDKAYGRDFYYIIIVEKTGVVENIFNGITEKLTLNLGFNAADSIPAVICYGNPLFNNVHIWYDKDNEKAKPAAEQMISFVNDVYKSLSISKDGVKNNIDIYEAKTKAEIDGKIGFNSKLLSFSHYDPKSIFEEKNDFLSILNSVYTWFTYEDYLTINNITAETLGHENVVMANNFDYSDTFMFPNFSVASDGNVHGVCAGISHITSKVFNDGTLDVTSGTYTDSTGNTYSFDITKDPANKTLLNKGLGDYKSINFVKDHKATDGSLSVNLTEGEESFRNLALYYWNETNKRNIDKYAKSKLTSEEFMQKDVTCSNYWYNYDLVTYMKAALGSGKILDAGIILHGNNNGKDAFGHTVNIVGFADYKTNTNKHGATEETVFYVYDSNFPHTLGKLITFKMNYRDYRGDHFCLFYNYVTPSENYVADSGSYNCLVVFDEDYNILNDQVKELD